MRRILKTKQDAEDFVRGCTFYGTGGGGLPERGLESLLSEMEQGKEVGWIDVNELPDDALTVCPFLMGSIAPHTPEVLEEMKSFGLTTPLYDHKNTLAKAIMELSLYTGKKIDAVVPIELGGANTPSALAAGVVNGIPTVDGDYTGRAIPEIPQTTPYLFDKTLWPISSVDAWGNVSIIKDVINYAMAERIGKLISTAAYGLTGDAGFLMPACEMKKVVIPGTLTECYNVGKLIREAREQGEDPVRVVVDDLKGWILVRGKVTGKEWEDRVGYYWGTHTITGEGEYAGDVVKIWFKNENHICWKNDEVIVTSPDIIIVVNADNGEPIANPSLSIGDHVAVIGLQARPVFRSEKGINILGPRAFGFDCDYVPIENRMK
ncbi:hypothetical protein DUF917 [Thermacetogenium phaeum DSM 12270]|uniref:DUF917 domain-containing protein n=1 Tax=Thermacetogenium phaeum (strain ATCC BAA-254 / DSM 26808 / PB) TaxID=1089553 RepID=K4LIX9_THEPS|nr:DUF917 domain-containing protein [Thermacetogenium phaeum]AFV11915.1 hypothetical protein DUF917 [Thermacetogenium phaeum DSM 12270]